MDFALGLLLAEQASTPA